jgi:mannan endo-1,6-alpha-mannosidase
LINCTGIDHHQWTYNVGVYLYGAAVLSNYTNASSIWVERTNGLLDATSTFFSPNKNASDILFEAQCELDYSCNVDQLSMKAYLSRWLASTSLLAPWTAGRIGSILRPSALGAAASCTGPPDGNTCGVRWYTNYFDNRTGVGQQLSAMEVMYALLVNETTPPATLPNVVIQLAPDNISTTSATPTAEGTNEPTSRPLFDSQQGIGAKLRATCITLSLGLAMACVGAFVLL